MRRILLAHHRIEQLQINRLVSHLIPSLYLSIYLFIYLFIMINMNYLLNLIFQERLNKPTSSKKRGRRYQDLRSNPHIPPLPINWQKKSPSKFKCEQGRWSKDNQTNLLQTNWFFFVYLIHLLYACVADWSGPTSITLSPQLNYREAISQPIITQRVTRR